MSSRQQATLTRPQRDARPAVRLYGDPFAGNSAAGRLLALLASSVGNYRIALCLTPVARGQEAVESGALGRSLPLTDGRSDFFVRTTLSDAELAPVLRAIEEEVDARAPVVVFGADWLRRQAELEFPDAVEVVLCESVDTTVERLRQMPVMMGAIDPFSPARRECFVHIADADPERSGTQLVLDAYASFQAEVTHCPPLIVFGPLPSPVAIPGVSFQLGLPGPEVWSRAYGLIQPQRRVVESDWEWISAALVGSVPLALSSFAATNARLGSPGVYLPIGGRHVEDARGCRFEPDSRAVDQCLQDVLDESARAVGSRGRAHVLRKAWTGRDDVPAPSERGARPRVVLEAPIFETSSSSVLTLATARALLARDHVDLCLKPRIPFENDLATFAAENPDLVPYLQGLPEDADLWISAGWPVRLDRPAARSHVVRFDWEYGALPVAASPVVTQEADAVIVHSRAVARSVTAAGGAEGSRVVRIPHGVDGRVFHPDAAPLSEVIAFKRNRRALLFVGGLIWRKGIDLLLKALLEGWSRTDDVCLVIKSLGDETSYRGQSLVELVNRVRQYPGAPEIMVIDRRLSAAEMAGLYTASDLFVHPYRGEGFCMPALEARACGLPVMVTAGGSTDDFCTGAASVRVPSVRRHVPLPKPHLGQPFVLEPDHDAMAELLRSCLHDLDSLGRAARREAQGVRDSVTWDQAAARIEQLAYHAAGNPRSALVSRVFADCDATRTTTDEQPLCTIPQEPPRRLARSNCHSTPSRATPDRGCHP